MQGPIKDIVAQVVTMHYRLLISAAHAKCIDVH